MKSVTKWPECVESLLIFSSLFTRRPMILQAVEMIRRRSPLSSVVQLEKRTVDVFWNSREEV